MTREDLRDAALVVLNYNTQDLTISAVNCILALHTGIHIVLVDNASSDGSLEAFKKEFKGNKDVSILASKENGGYAKGNNFAFSFLYEIKGIDYVGVMNPDVRIKAKDLRLLVNALRSDAKLGLVTGRTIYSGEIWEPNPCAWKRARIWRWIFCESLIGSAFVRMGKRMFQLEGMLRGYYQARHYCKKVVPVDIVQGCCFFSRVATIKKIGGFDERTFLYFEEDFLAEKIKKIGLHNAVVSEAWLRHDHQEKEAKLICSATRIFHLTCTYEAKTQYVKECMGYGPVMLAMLKAYFFLDFHLKCFLIHCIYKH